MGQRVACYLLFALLVVDARAAALDITLYVVDPSGKPVNGCRVRHFREWNVNWDKGKEYRNQFRGLVGRNIPYGKFEVEVGCGDEKESLRIISIDHEKQFEVMSLAPGKLIFEGVQPPTLDVKLTPPAAQNEIWWIRLNGIYSSKTYIDRFGPQDSTAHLSDPDPGMYVATVYSSAGYVCVREVEFTNFSHRWTFHPPGCVFEFDEFAHVLDRDDNYRKKNGSWDEHIRKRDEEFDRGRDEAAQKTKEEMNQMLSEYCSQKYGNKIDKALQKSCKDVLNQKK